MSTDLARPELTGLLDVTTGELLPATIANAARVIASARAMKQHIQQVIAEATAYLAAESELQGTKTLHGGDETVELKGGRIIEYDAVDLMDALRLAGCPENRIEQAVVATITYKVDRSILRQLAAANDDYKAAIELAASEVDRPYQATVKLRRQKPDE